MPLLNLDEHLWNADWPKRTDDRFLPPTRTGSPSPPKSGEAKYSPDQPRDDHGRWTDDGGGSDDGDTPRVTGGKEAGVYLAERHPGTVWGLGKMAPTYVPTFTQLADRLWSAHPGAGAHVRGVEVAPMQPENGHAYAQYDHENRWITLSDKWFTDAERLDDQRAVDRQDGWTPPGAQEPSWSITHEFGHAWDDWARTQSTPPDDTFQADTYQRLGRVSGYGDRAFFKQLNGREQFAEAFACAELDVAPAEAAGRQFVGEVAAHIRAVEGRAAP